MKAGGCGKIGLPMYVLRKIDLAVQKELYYRLFGDEQFPTQLTGRK